jgi:hypothetical protein
MNGLFFTRARSAMQRNAFVHVIFGHARMNRAHPGLAHGDD